MGSLSDKKGYCDVNGICYQKKDVKQFIQRIICRIGDKKNIMIIEEEAGKELTDGN